MRFHFCGSGMIAGDDQDVGLERQKVRQGLVDAFDDFDFALKVPVFPHAVGFFDMDEEEVVLRPCFLGGSEFVFGRLTLKRDDFHPNQVRHTAIHRINCNAAGVQSKHLIKLGQTGVGGKPPHRERVGFRLVGDQLLGFRSSLAEDFCGSLSFGIVGLDRQDWHAGCLRIRILNFRGEAFSSHQDGKAVFFDVLDNRFHAGNGNGL